MSLAAPTQRELDELVAAVVDETITAEQIARLQQLLQDSGEAQQHFVRAMGLHASLYGYAAEEKQPPTSDAEKPAAGTGRWRAAVGRAVQLITRPTPFSLTVAALVIGLLVTAMAFIVPPIYQASYRAGGQPNSSRVVARLTGVQDAVWVEGQVGAYAGAHLVAGHRMNLRQGLAEVTFHDGAVVILEGPARLHIEDAGAAVLNAGTLRANVPEQAIGFKVSTPLMEVVDLGTEFGIVVKPDKSSEVHVLRGRVAVSAAGTAGRVVLGAGQAWRIGVEGSGTLLAHSDPQRFALTVAHPAVAVFQEGRAAPITGEIYDGVDDAMLPQWSPDWNFGTRTDFDIGQLRGQRAHALLRFDLSSLQGKVDRVLSVTLRIQPNADAAYFPWQGTGTIELYRVADANADWREGTFYGGDAPGAGEGEATWNYLGHPNERWAGAPGAAALGSDVDAAPLAAAAYVSRTGYPLDFRVGGDLEFVRGWIEGKTNGGFLLREVTGGPHNRVCFHSSESDNAAARPQLIITYLPKPAAGNEKGELHHP